MSASTVTIKENGSTTTTSTTTISVGSTEGGARPGVTALAPLAPLAPASTSTTSIATGSTVSTSTVAATPAVAAATIAGGGGGGGGAVKVASKPPSMTGAVPATVQKTAVKAPGATKSTGAPAKKSVGSTAGSAGAAAVVATNQSGKSAVKSAGKSQPAKITKPPAQAKAPAKSPAKPPAKVPAPTTTSASSASSTVGAAGDGGGTKSVPNPVPAAVAPVAVAPAAVAPAAVAPAAVAPPVVAPPVVTSAAVAPDPVAASKSTVSLPDASSSAKSITAIAPGISSTTSNSISTHATTTNNSTNDVGAGADPKHMSAESKTVKSATSTEPQNTTSSDPKSAKSANADSKTIVKTTSGVKNQGPLESTSTSDAKKAPSGDKNSATSDAKSTKPAAKSVQAKASSSSSAKTAKASKTSETKDAKSNSKKEEAKKEEPHLPKIVGRIVGNKSDLPEEDEKIMRNFLPSADIFVFSKDDAVKKPRSRKLSDEEKAKRAEERKKKSAEKKEKSAEKKEKSAEKKEKSAEKKDKKKHEKDDAAVAGVATGSSSSSSSSSSSTESITAGGGGGGGGGGGAGGIVKARAKRKHPEDASDASTTTTSLTAAKRQRTSIPATPSFNVMIMLSKLVVGGWRPYDARGNALKSLPNPEECRYLSSGESFPEKVDPLQLPEYGCQMLHSSDPRCKGCMSPYKIDDIMPLCDMSLPSKYRPFVFLRREVEAIHKLLQTKTKPASVHASDIFLASAQELDTVKKCLPSTVLQEWTSAASKDPVVADSKQVPTGQLSNATTTTTTTTSNTEAHIAPAPSATTRTRGSKKKPVGEQVAVLYSCDQSRISLLALPMSGFVELLRHQARIDPNRKKYSFGSVSFVHKEDYTSLESAIHADWTILRDDQSEQAMQRVVRSASFLTIPTFTNTIADMSALMDPEGYSHDVAETQRDAHVGAAIMASVVPPH